MRRTGRFRSNFILGDLKPKHAHHTTKSGPFYVALADCDVEMLINVGLSYMQEYNLHLHARITYTVPPRHIQVSAVADEPAQRAASHTSFCGYSPSAVVEVPEGITPILEISEFPYKAM